MDTKNIHYDSREVFLNLKRCIYQLDVAKTSELRNKSKEDLLNSFKELNENNDVFELLQLTEEEKSKLKKHIKGTSLECLLK